MTRRTAFLLVLLALAVAFSGWQWARPYEWKADPGARFKIVHSSVKRDHDYWWLDLYLKKTGDQEHDLTQPVVLRLADGREIEPADTTLEGDRGQAVRALGLRFWLKAEDFAGPLELRLNEGGLRVRSGSGPPSLGKDESRFFTTRNW